MSGGITDLIREATGGARPGKTGQLAAFAKAIGTTATTVSRWREGTIPGPQWRKALADYFDTTEDDIELASRLEGVSLDDLDARLDTLRETLTAEAQSVRDEIVARFDGPAGQIGDLAKTVESMAKAVKRLAADIRAMQREPQPRDAKSAPSRTGTKAPRARRSTAAGKRSP